VTPTATPQPPTPGPTPQPGQIEYVKLPGGEELELIWIPGGEFLMGCTADEACDESEQPQHRVRVDGYWMGKFEVSQKQWKSVMRRNPSEFAGDTRPVDSVSWVDVQQFLHKAGLGLRLPTEAEWEYAARGGAAGHIYPWGNQPPDGTVANYCDAQCGVVGMDEQTDDGSAPGGNYPANGFGLYDLSGNVSEWVRDGFRAGAYKTREGVSENPVILEGQETTVEGTRMELRVLRGGNSCGRRAGMQRARARVWTRPASGWSGRTPPPSAAARSEGRDGRRAYSM
jgi:formylglycine-generating enzyme required for sulfatase activity